MNPHYLCLGWEAPVPATAWGGSCAHNAIIRAASINLSATASSIVPRASPQPAAWQISSQAGHATPDRSLAGASKPPAVPGDEAEEVPRLLAPAVCLVSTGLCQVASAGRAACAGKPATVDPAAAEELPLPLPPALRALAQQQCSSCTTGAEQSRAAAVPAGRAADVAIGQRAQSAPTGPPAQPARESKLEANGSEPCTCTAAEGNGSLPARIGGAYGCCQGDAENRGTPMGQADELEHPWDQASSSADSSAVTCQQDIACGADSLPSACSETADDSQGGWTQQAGQQPIPHVPAARVLKASRDTRDRTFQTRSMVPRQAVLPGMTTQGLRQVSFFI